MSTRRTFKQQPAQAISYTSFVVFEPPSYPGVRFRLHKPNDVRRGKLTLEVQDHRVRMRSRKAEADAIIALPPAERNPEQIQILTDMMEAELAFNFKPVYLRLGVAGIEGFQIDGQVPDLQAFIELGPQDLINAVTDRIFELFHGHPSVTAPPAVRRPQDLTVN